MIRERRTKLLKSIALSPEGEALKDLLNELIGELKNASSFPAENFEIEGKASLKAAAKIEKIIYILNSFKTPATNKQKNPYE